MTGFFRDDLNDYNKGEVQRVSPTIFWGKDEAPTVFIGEGLLPEDKYAARHTLAHRLYRTGGWPAGRLGQTLSILSNRNTLWDMLENEKRGGLRTYVNMSSPFIEKRTSQPSEPCLVPTLSSRMNHSRRVSPKAK
jgi:hypothetical protein